MKTKPFNLDKARDGHPVCTRDLRPARIVCDNMSDGISKDIILALVSETDGSETAYAYNRDGTFMGAGEQHRLDLQLATTKKSGWINLYVVYIIVGVWLITRKYKNSKNNQDKP